jgi:hypothetical protein
MTRHTVHIDRLVLRGTAVDSLHAERLRGLVRDELARILNGGTGGELIGPVPATSEPEHIAGPVAHGIAAKLPREASR